MPDNVLVMLDQVPADSIVALDTETSGLHFDDGARVAVVSLAWFDQGRLESVALPFDQGHVPGKPGAKAQLFPPDYNLSQTEWERLLEWLQTRRLVMHNGKFDLHMMRTGTRLWPGVDLEPQLVWDTILVNRVLDPEHPTGLKPTAERFGFGLGGDERDAETRIKKAAKTEARGLPQDYRYDLVDDWPLVERYARLDAEFTLQLFQLQHDRIVQGEGSFALADRELQVSKTLYRMEQRGIGFRRKAARRAADVIRQRRDAIAAGLPFEPSLPAAKRYWFEEIVDGREPRLMAYAVTPTGKPQLNKDVLKRMADDGVEWAKEWTEYTRLDKMLSMWYVGWADMCGTDGRLRTTFNQLRMQEDDANAKGTVSGRFSVERVQLQAIPHDYQLAEGITPVRALFRAAKGKELWEIDLAQAEVRVASSITKCKPMIDGIIQGDDAHTIVTKRVFGIDPSHPEWDFYRSVGKRLVFAMIYGAGKLKVQEQILFFTGRKVAFETVDEWVTKFRNDFPEFPRYARRLSNRVEKGRTVRLVSGLVRHFQPYEQTHKAFNAEIQGGVAESMKDWMVWVEESHPGVMLVQIHDSLILEVPKGLRGEMVTTEVVKAGEQIFERQFPGVPFKAEAKRWTDKG